MTWVEDRHRQFIGRIGQLVEARNNRGTGATQDHFAGVASAQLAALRRGLGREMSEVPEVFPIIVPMLPDFTARPISAAQRERDEHTYFQVAALYAWHGINWRGSGTYRRDLGASLYALSQKGTSESMEKRFVAMLDCHRDELDTHLRSLVGILRTGDQPIAWPQLLADLEGTHWEERRTQTLWARSYWGGPARDTADAADATATAAEAATEEGASAEAG